MKPDSPSWLKQALFYEIYPQSFCDSNGDGIGDLQGIIQKLDYIQALGVNALWLNPCFDSPFKDAGYDVRDYFKVAARYGSNEDIKELFEEAHARNIKVLLDLVPGHTSEEHPWFLASKTAEKTDFDDRYIWTDSAFRGSSLPFVSGESERDGAYILNFFKCQPALNYGFAKIEEKWQLSDQSEAAKASRQALVDIMCFWLKLGCDGFRVDMANSLVKNDDEQKSHTIATWQDILPKVRQLFPEAAFVSEWCVPPQAFAAGFDLDFYLDWRRDGFGNGYNRLLRSSDTPLIRDHDMSYFNCHSPKSIVPFLEDYWPQYLETKEQGCFCFITGNHDTSRLAPRLTDRERRLAYLMILTLPGAPFIYYGDEIGLSSRALKTKEGGYQRTGARAPMQWAYDEKNLGFSDAAQEALYLPIEEENPVDVKSQENDPSSLLHFFKAILSLRKNYSALEADADMEIVAAPHAGRYFAYVRKSKRLSQKLLIVINPDQNSQIVDLTKAPENSYETFKLKEEDCQKLKPIFSIGEAALSSGKIQLSGQSAFIYELP